MNSNSIIKMICQCVVVLLVILFPISSLVRQVSAETITITWSVQAANQGTKTVTVGSTVKWIWGDTAPHNVLSTNPDFKNSPLMSPPYEYEFTFTKAGSYPYYCSVHTRMVGTIEVQEAIITASAEPSLKPVSLSPSRKSSVSPQSSVIVSTEPSPKPISSLPSNNNPTTIQPSLRFTPATVPASAEPSHKLLPSRNWYQPTTPPPKPNKPWMLQ